jgi:hypothetical protein
MNEIHHPPSASNNSTDNVVHEQDIQTEDLSPATKIIINSETPTAPITVNSSIQPAVALPAFKDMTAAQKRQLIKVMSGMIAGVLWKSLKPFIIAGILSGAIYYSYERSASAHRDTVSQHNKAPQAIDVPK